MTDPIFGMTFLPLLTWVLCPMYLFSCFAVILIEWLKWREGE